MLFPAKNSYAEPNKFAFECILEWNGSAQRRLVLFLFALENTYNFRNFDTLIIHVRFLEKKLGHILCSPKSTKITSANALKGAL